MNDDDTGTRGERAAAALALRPLTARSIVLSTLLGHHPPRLPARALVRVGELFGIAEGTVRVALSRMVAAGDLYQSDGSYALTPGCWPARPGRTRAAPRGPAPGAGTGRSP